MAVNDFPVSFIQKHLLCIINKEGTEPCNWALQPGKIP